MGLTPQWRAWWNGHMDASVHQPATGGGAALRLFVAMELPTEQARQLADYGEAIAARLGGASVAAAPNLHLTVAFLGDVPEEYVPAVAERLDEAAECVPGPTACSVTGVTTFGRAGRALGVEVDVELLAPISACRDRLLDAVLPYALHADTRRWRPHVTVLRTRAREALARELGDVPPAPALQWVAPGLALHASLPAPGGRHYRRLHTAAFGARVRQH